MNIILENLTNMNIYLLIWHMNIYYHINKGWFTNIHFLWDNKMFSCSSLWRICLLFFAATLYADLLQKILFKKINIPVILEVMWLASVLKFCIYVCLHCTYCYLFWVAVTKAHYQIIAILHFNLFINHICYFLFFSQYFQLQFDVQ